MFKLDVDCIRIIEGTFGVSRTRDCPVNCDGRLVCYSGVEGDTDSHDVPDDDPGTPRVSTSGPNLLFRISNIWSHTRAHAP